MDAIRATRIDTDIKVMPPYEDLQPDARITNLSTSGAFIKTSRPLAVETMFVLNFRLPADSEVITVHARVAWSRCIEDEDSSGMGVQFTSIEKDHQNKLVDLIQNKIWGDSEKPASP